MTAIAPTTYYVDRDYYECRDLLVRLLATYARAENDV